MDHGESQPKFSGSAFPFTVRGLLLLVIALYLLLVPVREKSDIIATGFASCSLAILGLLGSLALLSRRRLCRDLKINFSPDDLSRIAGVPITLVSRLSGLSISPFYELRIRYQFAQGSLETVIHSLDASCPRESFISESIVFPHRGNWLLDSISLTLVDKLGFTSVRLPSLRIAANILVEPAPYACPRWPIIASTVRVDDQINHPVERKGDLYDLRQYHPADGTRKIVWKLFAKSGQLFSRFPEPAYSPEGEVILFCLARRQDDKLAAETLAYLAELERLDIEIRFASLSNQVAIEESAEKALQSLIENAWTSDLVQALAAQTTLRELTKKVLGSSVERNIQTVILAVSESSLADPHYQKIVSSCQSTLISSGIRPSIFISSSKSLSISELKFEDHLLTSKHSAPLIERFESFFIEPSRKHTKKVDPLKQAHNFIKTFNSANADLAWS